MCRWTIKKVSDYPEPPSLTSVSSRVITLAPFLPVTQFWLLRHCSMPPSQSQKGGRNQTVFYKWLYQWFMERPYDTGSCIFSLRSSLTPLHSESHQWNGHRRTFWKQLVESNWSRKQTGMVVADKTQRSFIYFVESSGKALPGLHFRKQVWMFHQWLLPHER